MPMDRNTFLSAQQLHMMVVLCLNDFREDALSNPKIQKAVIPPEAKRIGVPVTTDIPGFDRDARAIIQIPLLAAFPKGTTAGKAASFANDIAERYKHQENSAGPYLHHSAKNLAEALDPGFYAPAPTKSQGVSVVAFFNEVRAQDIRSDAWNNRYLNTENWTGFSEVSEENISTLITKIEKLAEEKSGLDPDGMAYEWPVVESALRQAFRKLINTKPAASGAIESPDHDTSSPPAIS